MPHRSRLAAAVFITVAAALTLSPQAVRPAALAAQPDFSAGVQGTVTDSLTGFPVAGASVSAAELELSAATDASGHFEWRSIPLLQESLPVTMTITAAGYGDWTIQNARLVAADTLIVTAELSAAPTVVVIPAPDPNRTDWPSPNASEVGALADQSRLPLPSTIRVRVTGWGHCDLGRPYTVDSTQNKVSLDACSAMRPSRRNQRIYWL